jgi:hypothetical protein
VPTASEPLLDDRVKWASPAAQARGPDWVYDVFTPPEIFYLPASGRFSVRSSKGAAAEENPAEPFGLELIAIEHEPFRLQLTGYVGGEGNWRGTFQNRVTGEVVVARAGHRFRDLGLVVNRLEVRHEPIAVERSMATLQRVAAAVVHDERSGREVALTNRTTVPGESAHAVIVAEQDGIARCVRAGDTLTLGDARFHVETIDVAARTIDVTRHTNESAPPLRRTLTPRDARGDPEGVRPDGA